METVKTIDELFEEVQKLPDWERFPWPEAFWKHFNVRKPQAASIMECANYFPPAHLSLGNGKTEIRGPAPGGVRVIENYMSLPVEIKMITEDETTNQNVDDKHEDFAPNLLNPPIEHNRQETLGVLGHQSPNLSYDVDDTKHDAVHRDVECSLPSQPLQNPHS